MQASNWAIVVAAAVVAVVAGRHASRSRLAVAIALVGATLAALAVAYAALGYAGCTARGDCSGPGAVLHTILGVEFVVLVVLVVAAVVRAVWRRHPRGARRPRQARRAGRMRARDLWMMVGCVPLALLSIAVIAFGESAARLSGIALLLFSAVGLLVAVSGRLAARSGVAPELGRVEHDGTLQPALVIPGSAVKLRLIRLAMVCFAALGLLAAIWPRALLSHSTSVAEVRTWGIACAVVFGGLLLLRRLYARGRYRVALLSSGLRWELGGGPFYVAWDDIIGARAYTVRSAWRLAVDARPGGRRESPRVPWPARLERALSRSASSIPLEEFPVDPQRLAALVRSCATEPEKRQGIVSERNLAWLTGQADLREARTLPAPS